MQSPGPPPPFAHTPYDGSSYPFTVGLRPIEELTWLEPDPLIADHLARKRELISGALESVFRAEADMIQAQHEVLDLICENLERFHSASHRFEKRKVFVAGVSEPVCIDHGPPLLAASLIVQEDLVIMRASPEGYRLAAASLCFPSSWSLEEKFSKPMSKIHENVPGFNGARMGRTVERLFENLKPGQLVCRYNWAIYDDANLYHPKPKQIEPAVRDADGNFLANLFLRVERQTLKRLPKSRDILFTIKVHHDPLSFLRAQENRHDIARGLRNQLLALKDDQLTYKGLARHREALADELSRLVNSEGRST
ncbi:uncharacterized protein DUF3445 [Roseibium hamelinense]|uniref:Uncharacterized protein DUF3445 n=1 Tax=Roseibium hamelinense TaxID=150831 RepID=A0A562SNN8_9HYPH|nr:DUF3445 domain-containing protein [Roseibium hamelinense]MTI45036.1 DUF3445 domain-containing protein [Roseibium hamelinense]TWI82300.1 uncharacterized protein DUF3445 [Roseibium hamelinense]